jgi:tRNA (cytidine/uridine-2'-O-)-methyltransferase
MFHIVLFEPEIPPNTGNIMRLCANTGSYLHLIEPLGFELDDKKLRRAGLDYRDGTCVQSYENLDAFIERVRLVRLFGCSTRGRKTYNLMRFAAGDGFLFGPETRGLPASVLDRLGPEQCLRIPMVAGNRSINLSNAVAIVLFEAWRQCRFAGASDPSSRQVESPT